MKTLLASILLAVAVPAIVCGQHSAYNQYPYSTPSPYVQSGSYRSPYSGALWIYQRDNSLERFRQQLFWDDYEFQNALRRAARGGSNRSPWTNDYSVPDSQKRVNSFPDPPPRPMKYVKKSDYKPQSDSKNYSKKVEIKLPKTKPGKPGELPKAHGNN